MSTYSNSVGIHNVGSYQVSGTPFVFNVASNETKTATLKYVTLEVQVNVAGTAGATTISFGDASSTTYTLPLGLSTFKVKCKSVAVIASATAAVSVCISLTNIPSKHLSQHTQSDWGGVA